MSKSKEANAKPAILDYLNKQNRPYSAIDIFNNLHKEYGKTLVVRSLEELVQSNQIKDKTYGKQKVYVADQSQFPMVEDSELKKMDTNITQLSDSFKSHQDSLRQLETELRGLQSALTTEEAQGQLQELNQQLEKSKNKLADLKDNNNSVSPEERQIIMAAREKYVKAWRKRRRMAKDVLDSILEGYPKSKKQLFEDIGIETDEEYNVTPPEL